MKKLLIIISTLFLGACVWGGGISATGGSNGANLGLNFGTGLNIAL